MTRPSCPPPEVRRLFVVCSNPYDVTFALGGVIAAFVDAGTVVQVVCLTHGRRPDATSRRRTVRASQLTEAARLLGVEEATILDHRAGHIRWNDPDALAAEVRRLAEGADALLTVDARDPRSHPDHVRTMQAAVRAARSMRSPVYGWLRHPVADRDDLPSGVIPVDSDRVRQRAAIAAHGPLPDDDPIHSLPGGDADCDVLAVIPYPPGPADGAPSTGTPITTGG